MEPIYAFIGGGNMGRALIGGLIKSGLAASQIRVADSDANSRALCEKAFTVRAYADNIPAITHADVIVLAVKPQHMQDVVERLAPAAKDAALYLSIAAGITTTRLASWLGRSRAIVRCMPNTPALVGNGMSALYANAQVSDEQRQWATRLLGAVGRAEWLTDEGMMDAVTAVSGSGPAYFFLFIELIEKAATELGLPLPLARTLALETARGAANLACDSEHSPATLRAQVTSPGGTTERALAVFADADLAAIVQRALTAARDRSIALAKGVED